MTKVTTKLVASSRFASLEKLKRAAARAVDPWRSRPLIDTPAYANSTALITGQCVKANGNIYVCVSPGTTAASGTGPSATTGNPTDGTASFTYYSPAPANYTDPDAPTVTVTTSSPVGTLPNVMSPEPLTSVGAANGAYVPGFMTPIGAYVAFDGTNRNQLLTFDRRTAGAADPVGKYTGWEFETDAPSLALRFRTISLSRTIGVEINDRVLLLGGVALPVGGQSWLKLDFPADVRITRKIRMWHGQGGDVRLADVYLGGRDYIQPTTAEKVRAVFISDSLLDGSAWGPVIAGGSAQQRIAAALGWDDPWSFAQGSTGYINPGTGPYYTYIQRIAEAATRNPDVWVLMGSTNDGAYTSAERRSAILACLVAIRAVSQAPIFAMGVWSVNTGTPVIEADVKAAFDTFAAADRNCFYIPISSPTFGLPWITGAWNNAGHSASSNSGYTISSDAIHPHDSGTVIEAARAANEIRRALMAA